MRLSKLGIAAPLVLVFYFLGGASREAADEPQAQSLEGRVKDLEKRLGAIEDNKGRGESAREPGSETPVEVEEKELSENGLTAGYGSLRLTFQIFGDIGFRYRNPSEEQSHASFAFGSLGLLTMAKVGQHFQALSETVIEGEDDEVGLDQERLWGRWVFSDLIYVKVGLEHTNACRWNRVYHHSKWLEPSIKRPFLCRFEDDEGILPMHSVGPELGGTLDTSVGGFEYSVTLSNGRGPTTEDRQRVSDLNDAKAWEGALAFMPASVQGLRIGGSLKYDEVPGLRGNPSRKHSIREFESNAYVEFKWRGLETLTEVAFVQNKDHTVKQTFHHYSAYLQAGYQVKAWTPYTRFDIREMEQGDPFYSSTNVDLDKWEQIIGIRYDLNENAAIKLELGVGREQRRSESGVVSSNTYWTIASQLAWFF